MPDIANLFKSDRKEHFIAARQHTMKYAQQSEYRGSGLDWDPVLIDN